MGEAREDRHTPTESLVLPCTDSGQPGRSLMYQESGGKILERQERLQSAHKRSLIMPAIYG